MDPKDREIQRLQGMLTALERKVQDGALLENRRYVFPPRDQWKPLSGPQSFPLDSSDPYSGPLAVRYGEGLMLPREKSYLLPDGAMLCVDQHGNYAINDADAKVVYQANRKREFNPYINASDLIERFIREVGKIDGVKQNEVLRLPVEAFINWLILQAAKRDGDSTDGLPTVEEALRIPHENSNLGGQNESSTRAAA